jgi:hypothetical protein
MLAGRRVNNRRLPAKPVTKKKFPGTRRDPVTLSLRAERGMGKGVGGVFGVLKHWGHEGIEGCREVKEGCGNPQR